MIEYRVLNHADYDDIVDISKGVWEGGDYLPSVFHSWVDAPGVFIGGVDSETGKVVSTGKFSILYDGSGWLEGLRVHKDYRGKKLARDISIKALNIAKEYLSDGKIKRIAFATHVTNSESIHIMENMDFILAEKFILVSKEYDKITENMKIEDYDVKAWNPTYDEFRELEFIKARSNLIPLSFIFQRPTKELYEEYLNNGCFVTINGFNGIFKLKGEPYFAVEKDSFEGINTFMNYYLLKYKNTGINQPITSVLPSQTELIEKLQKNDFEAWNDWQPDYLYYIYA